VAETTQDEREPEGTEDEGEPQASEDERKPEGTEDEGEPQASEEERKPEGTEDEGEPKASEDERKPEPKDLPEPEEKSVDDLLGQQVVDSHGYNIGKIDALFKHGQDERASWARVKSGLVRTSSAFVPLHDAQDDGGQVRVVYEKEHVGAAPEIEPEGNELSDEDADVLHKYYGLERVKDLSAEIEQEEVDLPRETRDANPPTMEEPPWAVEKYPLPDMERPEGKEPEGEGSSAESSQDESSQGESSQGEGSHGEGSQGEASSEEDSEEDTGG
jgi:hypothetical protein